MNSIEFVCPQKMKYCVTLYSSVMVVLNMNGEPRATAHARARSVALPETSWWTANDALIPAPFLDLPYIVVFGKQEL